MKESSKNVHLSCQELMKFLLKFSVYTATEGSGKMLVQTPVNLLSKLLSVDVYENQFFYEVRQVFDRVFSFCLVLVT